MIIIIGVLIVALAIKSKYREVLYHSEKERLVISLVILVVMVSWELFSTHAKIWLYPGPGMIGIFIFGLPIELFLFYLVLPYCVFTVFECIHKNFDHR